MLLDIILGTDARRHRSTEQQRVSSSWAVPSSKATRRDRLASFGNDDFLARGDTDQESGQVSFGFMNVDYRGYQPPPAGTRSYSSHYGPSHTLSQDGLVPVLGRPCLAISTVGRIPTQPRSVMSTGGRNLPTLGLPDALSLFLFCGIIRAGGVVCGKSPAKDRHDRPLCL